MSVRQGEGATLSLVAAVAIIIILIGVAFFFLAKIFGGQRELQNAADAGTLNIAKQALVEPSITLSTTDPLQAAMSTLDDTNGVNLFTFNRLVGQELIVAMNASADGNSTGLTNATDLVSDVQGLASSLTSALNNPAADSSWVSRFFNLANSNSVRMENQIASGSAIKFTPTYGSTWNTAYLAKGRPSNMFFTIASGDVTTGYSSAGVLPAYTDAGYLDGTQFNLSSIANGGSPAVVSGASYLAGYQTFTIPNVTGNICAVPIEPASPPHMVSNSLFSATQTPASIDVDAWVPPNSFETQSTTLAPKNGVTASNMSAAVIGCLQQIRPSGSTNPYWSTLTGAFTMAVPLGYIVVDNTGYINSGNTGSNPPGYTMPNTDNVDAQELGGAGITVAVNGTTPQCFADPQNSGLQNMQSWQDYINPPGSTNPNGQGPPPAQPSAQFNTWISAGPDFSGIYDVNGNAVTSQLQAFNLLNGTGLPSANTLCTDNNSSATSGTGLPPCIQEDMPNANAPLAPFNQAYHPNSVNAGNLTVPSLIAIEEAKCYVANLFGPTPAATGATGSLLSSFGPTGYRLYPPSPNDPLLGQPAPYNPSNFGFNAPGVYNNAYTGYGQNDVVQGNNSCSYCQSQPCQITTEGSLYALVQQVTAINSNTDPNNLAAEFNLSPNMQYAVQIGGSPSDGFGVSATGPLDQSGQYSIVTADTQPAVAPADQFYRFFAQRMHEIKPSVSQAEIDNIVKNTPVTMSQKLVLYLDTTDLTYPGGTFKFTPYASFVAPTGAGQWLLPFASNPAVTQPDGTPHWYQREYAALGSGAGDAAVNPNFEFGIHDQLFTRNDNGGDLAVFDTAGFIPASGAYNMLGYIYFQQYVTDNVALGKAPSNPPYLDDRN